MSSFRFLVVVAVLVTAVDQCSGSSAYTAEQQKYLLDEHNKFRSQEKAADMNMLVWHEKLATSAQLSADSCDYSHNFKPVSGLEYDEWVFGQNIYFHSAEHEVNKIVASWQSEKQFYNYDAKSCQTGRKCGHYTQVVWGSTKHVGCGYKYCTGKAIKVGGNTYWNGYIVVCNYGEGGNIRGMAPFTKGPPCSKCINMKPWCSTSGLCNFQCSAQSADCDCKVQCSNGATVTDACTCKCATGYTGELCQDICRDSDPYECEDPYLCDPNYVGDQMARYTQSLCPKTCGKCS